MTAKIPREWASNSTFSGGAHATEDTKVDPGAAIAANGCYPDLGFAAEHVNHQWNAMSSADRRAMLLAACHLTPLTIADGGAIDDGAEAMAAHIADVTAYGSAAVTLIKAGTADVFYAYDEQMSESSGTIASVTSAVRDAASNGSRIVAIGDGGNLNTYSDDNGDTWSAGAAGVAGAVQFISYSPHADKFIAGGSGTGSVYSSPDAATIWASAGTGFAAPLGLAVLSSGTIVVLGNVGIEPRFSRSTNDGVSYSGSVSPPSANTAEEPGDLAGCPQVSGNGNLVYHVMRCNAGARLRCAVSADGVTWTATATIEAPSGGGFSARPRLLCCKSTGLLVIAAPISGVGSSLVLYASIDGSDWVGPLLVRNVAVAAFAIQSGRLFMTRDDGMWASAGIG